jgi:hypothetical protein
MNWKKLYYFLLLERQVTDENILYEKHHVTPSSLGGKDSSLVKLTHKDHVLAHYIRYRWLGQYQDKVAYQMMNGQLLNPMHNPEIANMIAEQVRTPERRKINSVAQIKRFSDRNERKKVSRHRKKYIATLEDTKVLTQHMNDPKKLPELIKKRVNTYKQTRKENPKKFKEAHKKATETNKNNNKLLSKEQLKQKYSRGSGVDNPKWQGYVIFKKDNDVLIFESKKEATKNTNVSCGKINKYMNTNIPIFSGAMKGYIVELSKEIQ